MASSDQQLAGRSRTRFLPLIRDLASNDFDAKFFAARSVFNLACAEHGQYLLLNSDVLESLIQHVLGYEGLEVANDGWGAIQQLVCGGGKAVGTQLYRLGVLGALESKTRYVGRAAHLTVVVVVVDNLGSLT